MTFLRRGSVLPTMFIQDQVGRLSEGRAGEVQGFQLESGGSTYDSIVGALSLAGEKLEDVW